MTTGLKAMVRGFWDSRPCGTLEVADGGPGGRAFYAALDARRYRLEPFIERYAAFAEQRGRRVLEVGCGAGSDLVRFASAGARVTGLDLSPRSAALARERVALEGLAGDVCVGDAEALPFPDRSFDYVYAWGVLHHTPDTERAVAEVYRVLVPGGRTCVMLYHRHGLFALQAWLRFALLRGRPGTSLREVLARHVESPGTKGYSRREARALFASAGFADVTVDPVLTVWDARLGRRRFLPGSVRALLPQAWGWFLVVRGRRPAP